MKTYIDVQDIDLLCGVSQSASSYNSKAEGRCDEQGNQQGESESKCNKRLTFKEKIKNIWSKAKGVIFVGIDILRTIATLAKAVTGFVKCVHKVKGAFA